MIRNFLKDAATFMALVTFCVPAMPYAGQIAVALHPAVFGG